jgi:hypothetical protein
MMIDTIKELLAGQAALMLEFGNHEQELQSAVMQRDWPAVDALVTKMRAMSDELRAIDERRHAAIQAAKKDLGVNADASFAELLARLPAPEREELTALYRSLQVSVLRVTSVTRGIDAYVRGSIRTTNDILGEVFPDQRGTLYSRRGRKAPADQRAIVLDRHL